MRAAALLFITGCWTGAQAPLAQPPTAEKKSPVSVAPAQISEPGVIAMQMSRQLRENGPQLVLSMIRGPVVVFDIDAQEIKTLCGKAAERAAQSWGQLLIDESRADPMCLAGTNDEFTCVQVSPPDVLLIEVENPARWQIRSVTLGNGTSTVFRGKLEEVRTAVASATCP